MGEGEKGKFVHPSSHHSNSPIVYLRNHRVYKNCVSNMWLVCEKEF